VIKSISTALESPLHSSSHVEHEIGAAMFNYRESILSDWRPVAAQAEQNSQATYELLREPMEEREQLLRMAGMISLSVQTAFYWELVLPGGLYIASTTLTSMRMIGLL